MVLAGLTVAGGPLGGTAFSASASASAASLPKLTELARAWLLGLLDALVDDARLPAGQAGPLASALGVLAELHRQMPAR